MQIISEKQRLRELLATYESRRVKRAFFATGITQIDERFPEGGLALGAVHEVLSDPSHGMPGEGMPLCFVAMLARAALQNTTTQNTSLQNVTLQNMPVPKITAQSMTGWSTTARTALPNAATHKGVVVWSDPRGELYPPALAAMGVPAERCLILRPRNPAEELWAIHECLGCRGVAVTVATIPRMTGIEARRLQLAAERSGGVGLFLRPMSSATHYAAATRWLVAPVPGTRTTQRWKIQLLHGQGGHSGETFILEKRRDSKQANLVHPSAAVVDHARKARVG